MIDAALQGNLRKLLSDAVPMLCRNGLGLFNSQVSVEALIGVTINDSELILISFKEMVTADGCTVSHAWRKCDSGPQDDVPSAHPESREKLRSVEDDAILTTKRPIRDKSNQNCDVIDSDGVCYVESATEWNSVKPEQSAWIVPKSASRRKRKTSSENSTQSTSQWTEQSEFADAACQSKREDAEGSTSRSTTHAEEVPIKDEQTTSVVDECMFIKVEDADDYGFDAASLVNEAVLNSSFPAPVPKRSRVWSSYGGNPGSTDTHRRRSTESRLLTSKSACHFAQRQFQVRRAGVASNAEITRPRNSRQFARENLPMSQSAASLRQRQNTTEVGTIQPVNTVDPPFTCSICHARLGSQQTLMAHVKGTHLALERFACSICPERFRWFMQLHRHRKKCHPELQDSNTFGTEQE